MFNNCTGLYENTIEEINELIDRFYKKCGRIAEASGAESMLPYITQRDERIQQLENSSSSHYSEMQDLRRQLEKAQSERDSNYKRYFNENRENLDNSNKAKDGQKLLNEISTIKGYSRFATKKLRDKIKLHISK